MSNKRVPGAANRAGKNQKKAWNRAGENRKKSRDSETRDSETRDSCPTVGFSRIDSEHPDWGWNLNSKEARHLGELLTHIAVTSWSELLDEKRGGRLRHHIQEVYTLDKKAQRRLEKIFDENACPDTLFRFAHGNTFRIWGIKDGDHIDFLWFDRKHEVYPTKLRHT